VYVCVCVCRRARVYWPRCFVYLCVPIHATLDTRDCRARGGLIAPHVSVSHLADECRSIWFTHAVVSYDDDWPADRSYVDSCYKIPSSRTGLRNPSPRVRSRRIQKTHPPTSYLQTLGPSSRHDHVVHLTRVVFTHIIIKYTLTVHAQT
jgi:hypothetical protein